MLTVPALSGVRLLRAFRPVFLCLSLAVIAAAGGCGTGEKDAANSVSGKVTLNGENVAGNVSFVGADNKESPPALIKSDGTYSLPNPPTGTVKVLVKGAAGAAAPMAPPKDAPAMPKMGTGGGNVAPPAKYSSAATTDISFEVKPGKQKFDIALKP